MLSVNARHFARPVIRYRLPPGLVSCLGRPRLAVVFHGQTWPTTSPFRVRTTSVATASTVVVLSNAASGQFAVAPFAPTCRPSLAGVATPTPPDRSIDQHSRDFNLNDQRGFPTRQVPRKPSAPSMDRSSPHWGGCYLVCRKVDPGMRRGRAMPAARPERIVRAASRSGIPAASAASDNRSITTSALNAAAPTSVPRANAARFKASLRVPTGASRTRSRSWRTADLT